MSENQGISPVIAVRSAVKVCPWCRGVLVFAPRFPVTRLAPGESRVLRDDGIPSMLRTVPAWTCSTPHCKYREAG